MGGEGCILKEEKEEWVRTGRQRMRGVASERHGAVLVVPRHGDPVRNFVRRHISVIWDPQQRALPGVDEREGLLLNLGEAFSTALMGLAVRYPRRHDLEGPSFRLGWVRHILNCKGVEVSIGFLLARRER